jgi:hypothetical protein
MLQRQQAARCACSLIPRMIYRFAAPLIGSYFQVVLLKPRYRNVWRIKALRQIATVHKRGMLLKNSTCRIRATLLGKNVAIRRVMSDRGPQGRHSASLFEVLSQSKKSFSTASRVFATRQAVRFGADCSDAKTYCFTRCIGDTFTQL